MLKFLRKYRIILLAVGGSLLMVVFLLQPVLQQLTPDPRKKVIATIGGEGGTKIRMGDQVRANIELDILERFLPDLMTLIEIEPEHKAEHWILLKHEAERVGVMGVQQDGADWIPELAFGLVAVQAQLARQMGQSLSADQVNEAIQMTTQSLQLRRSTLLRNNAGLSEQAFNEILSKARGVTRLRRLYNDAPRFSEPRAIEAMERLASRVLTDQVVLGPELMLDGIEEPTEAELIEHFEQYKASRPGDDGANPFGFGYTLPARVKMAWLTLDPMRVAETVTPDPVQVRRRWQAENPDGGSFDEARAELERTIREEKVAQIMSEADEVIRGEILASLRGVEKEGIYRAIPEGWAAPDLEKVAQDVVAAVQDRHGVRIPLPSVIRRADAWLTPQQIQQQAGVGRAFFRVGNRTLPVSMLPSMVRGIGTETAVAVQIGVPIIDPVAEGAGGTRHYIVVLDAREESPPAGIDEIRDQLVRDVKSLKAFRALEGNLAEYRSLAQTGGLEAVIDLFTDETGVPRVRVRENIFVSEDAIMAATTESFQDSRANAPAFREAVVTVGGALDPLAGYDPIPLSESIVAAALPGSRCVALARVRAKVPPTVEEFRRFEVGLLVQETSRVVDEAETEGHPLRFDRLAERLKFVEVGAKKQDAAEG